MKKLFFSFLFLINGFSNHAQAKKIIVAKHEAIPDKMKWSKQLTEEEVKKYTPNNILGNWDPLSK